MQIRDGTPADAPTLVEFNARMALETESKTLDRATLTRGVERVLRDRTLGRYFVALDGAGLGGAPGLVGAERAGAPGLVPGVSEANAIIGCLMVTLEWSDWRDGHFWWIQSVFVREEARGRGVYSALHRHVIDEAKRAGNVVGVRLYVEPHNTRAQSTYAKLGMKKTYDVMEQAL